MNELSGVTENDRQAWSDIMLDYGYDAGEWMQARQRLTELLRHNGNRLKKVPCVPTSPAVPRRSEGVLPCPT